MNTDKLLVLGFAALGATAAFGALRAVTPVAWNGDPNCWQMKRHWDKMATVTNGGAKVVFIGDSITHFWESNGKLQAAKYFSKGDRRMLNLGTSADRTEHVLWRLTEGRELDGYEAKVVCLMIGTNNSGHFPIEKEPPIDAILGIRKILDVIREKQPKAKIVLTAIFPRQRDGLKDPANVRNMIVNKEIAKFADGENIFWCDFNAQFLTADGLQPREVFPDLLHPGPAGYEIWASAVLPYVDAALSDGRVPMPPSRYAAYQTAGFVRMDEPTSVFPVSRIEDGHDWITARLLQKRTEIADSNGEFDLVFLGDSITHNWETAGAESLAELRKTYSVLDIGYGGDRTENLIWRAENGELDGYKAKCVMLMIGTNNSWNRRESPADVAAGVRRALDVIARKQPQAKTLLLPIFPSGSNPQDAHRLGNEAANRLIEKFADGEKVIWVDFNAKFLDEKGDTKWIMPDCVHPNAAGYRDIWLPAVLPHFKAICGK